MSNLPTSDPLLWEALPDLTLNIAQTASLCGISVRQLGYWTRQGYVTAQGRGARRTYGLDALRRVLAIRKAMEAGASLRQSLRQVSSDTPADTLPIPHLEPPASHPNQMASLSRSLIEFFRTNSHTRDHAGGLAVKLGWAEDDMRMVADKLCASGVLIQDICQGMPVYHSAERGVSRA